jgi:hypothetical protein
MSWLRSPARMPFIATRRLVISRHTHWRVCREVVIHKKFIEILENVSLLLLAVVLIEHSPLLDYRGQWLKETRWIGKWLEKTGQRAYMRAFPLPKGGAMVQWIIERTVSLGGVITPRQPLCSPT